MIEKTSFKVSVPIKLEKTTGLVRVDGYVQGQINGLVTGEIHGVVRGDVNALIKIGKIEQMEEELLEDKEMTEEVNTSEEERHSKE